MKAYFILNSTLYTTDNNKVMITLNKMSEGCGASFTKMWYDKIANTTIPADQKTFKRFSDNFKTTFYPFDTKATAHLDLSKLIQKTTCLLDETVDDRF